MECCIYLWVPHYPAGRYEGQSRLPARLAACHDVVLIQESHGNDPDSCEFECIYSDFLAYHNPGSASNVGGSLIVIRKTFAGHFADILFQPLVEGRVSVLSCMGDCGSIHFLNVRVQPDLPIGTKRSIINVALSAAPSGPRTFTVLEGDYSAPSCRRLCTSTASCTRRTTPGLDSGTANLLTYPGLTAYTLICP